MNRRIWSSLAGVAAVITLGAARPAEAQCAAGYTQVSFASTFGCYRLTTSGMTWAGAQAQATSFGGYLAAIGSAAENAAVYSFASGLGRGTFFIGFTDEATEGTWVWVNGEPVVYTNWRTATGEPNNAGNEDYARVEGGPWNDVPASFQDFGVIEQRIAAVPEPATVALFAGGLLALAGSRVRRRR